MAIGALRGALSAESRSGLAEAVRLPNSKNVDCVGLTEYRNGEEADIRLYCFGNRNDYIETGKIKTVPLVRKTNDSGIKEGCNAAAAWACSR